VNGTGRARNDTDRDGRSRECLAVDRRRRAGLHSLVDPLPARGGPCDRRPSRERCRGRCIHPAFGFAGRDLARSRRIGERFSCCRSLVGARSGLRYAPRPRAARRHGRDGRRAVACGVPAFACRRRSVAKLACDRRCHLRAYAVRRESCGRWRRSDVVRCAGLRTPDRRVRLGGRGAGGRIRRRLVDPIEASGRCRHPCRICQRAVALGGLDAVRGGGHRGDEGLDRAAPSVRSRRNHVRLAAGREVGVRGLRGRTRRLQPSAHPTCTWRRLQQGHGGSIRECAAGIPPRIESRGRDASGGRVRGGGSQRCSATGRKRGIGGSIRPSCGRTSTAAFRIGRTIRPRERYAQTAFPARCAPPHSNSRPRPAAI